MRRTDPEVDLDLLSNGTGGDNAADLIHTTMALTTSRNAKAVLLFLYLTKVEEPADA